MTITYYVYERGGTRADRIFITTRPHVDNGRLVGVIHKEVPDVQ